MIVENYTGSGKVVLIAGGGRVYTDIAARFVKSERSLDDIVASPYSKAIVENILASGHGAALEFDYFIFGVEGFSRVTETQLVRKRLASYLIKSGRAELGGKRAFSVVYPEAITGHTASIRVPANCLFKQDGVSLAGTLGEDAEVSLNLDVKLLTSLTSQWYDSGIEAGFREEDLRYMKPQATEFKAIVGMNAHALRDWFAIRCCKNAQAEIRDLAMKMLKLCRQAAPDLFKGAGASCVQLGYCPENKLQNRECIGKFLTKDEALEVLRKHRSGDE